MDKKDSKRQAETPVSELLVTAIIRSSHGVGGCVKVESSSGEVDHLVGLKEALIRTGGQDGTVARLEIESAEGNPTCFLVKFRGIDTPEQARKLAGSEWLVSRDKACPLTKGEFYVSDLCQCVLVYKGTPVGPIIGVLEGGAGDLLEVSLTDGSDPDATAQAGVKAGKQTRLVPFRKEFVGKVDMASRTVELMHRWILE